MGPSKQGHRACEELTHDVFVEAYMGLRSFRFNAPFLHWLRRIAVRVGYRHWRTEKRDARIGSIEESQSHGFVPARMDQSTSVSDAAEYVHWLLSQLSPPDRLILTLIYLDSCSIKEAAFRCGWTVTTFLKAQNFLCRCGCGCVTLIPTAMEK